MRTVLMLFLTAMAAGPVVGQDDPTAWRSFLAGTWAEATASPDLHLAVDTAMTADTLQLRLTGPYAPPGVHREVVVCLVDWPEDGTFAVTGCPRTTLSRKAPPSDSTLHFHPQSKEGRGLQRRVRQFLHEPARSGDTLTVGMEERLRLVKQP